MWRHTNKSINAKHLTSEGKKLPSHFRQIVHDEREIHLEYLGIQLLQGHCSGSTDSTFFFTTDKFFPWQQSLDLTDSVLKSYLNGIPTGLLCLLAPKCSSVRIKLWKKKYVENNTLKNAQNILSCIFFGISRTVILW